MKFDGDIPVVVMDSGENRFHPDLLDGVENALDEVEKSGRAAVVLTGTGKFFSNGLDLEYLANGGPAYLTRVHRLFARLLGFPGYVVAAINGHAFAAGGMLAVAADARVMRADRGFFCLPEVDLGLPFSDGMNALLTRKLTPATAHEAMVTGRRYGGVEAAGKSIVDAAVAEDQVLATALERAREMAGKQPPAVAAIKRRMYEREIAVLEATG
ncbi:enoyl-CoA hydratase/isomerase family protein [Virgisporangium aliadipatigenens]|nr:enoyl-CoA hydratase/isomerase family protein [Virgisporangium aliadipatigenens]